MNNVLTFPPNMPAIAEPVAKAIGKLASQLLPETEKKLDALLKAGESLMGAIGELLAELEDERTPDHARDLATYKLTRARAAYQAIVKEAAKCVTEIDELRMRAEKEPSMIRAVFNELNAPMGAA